MPASRAVLTIPAILSSRKKILILVEWFTPGYKAGGPIRSCVNLCLALKESYDIYVLTTDTDHGETMPYTSVAANEWGNEINSGVQVYYAKKRGISTGQLATIIKAVDADYIYLNLLFSPHFVLYPLWLKYARKIRGKLILCPRGTLYDSAISLKWYKKKPMLLLVKWMGIHRQITFHATNAREQKAIRKYFPGSKTIIADNLPNTLQPAWMPCEKNVGSLRCIFVARIVPIKNLLYLLQLLGKLTQAITLTIAGPAEDKDYWISCEKAIGQLPRNIEVLYAGPIQNEALLPILQQHHLFILPTTGENFGHAIFEALLAGRPVLISDQTPWLHLAEHNSGWSLPLNDPSKFVAVINDLANCNQQQFDEYALAAWNYANHFIRNPALTEQYKLLFS